MRPPQGHPLYNKVYFKVNKVLYGLKQAGREWNEKLDSTLLEMKFKRLNSEPCILCEGKNKLKEIICILTVYVDDILLIGKENVIINIKEQIKMNYNIK